MSEQNYDGGAAHDPAARPPRWWWRVEAMARAAVGIGAGVAVGVTTKDWGLGVTVAAAAVNILRDVFRLPSD